MMRKLKTITPGLVVLALASHLCPANAVCLDPKTLVSGYKVPLASEIRSAQGIVVGRVLAEQGLREDPTDPDGYTAYIMTVEVLNSLKGKLPKVFVVRNENDSSRYPMKVGEVHVLFVAEDKRHRWIDSCGNSSAMPAATKVLHEIQAQLERVK